MAKHIKHNTTTLLNDCVAYMRVKKLLAISRPGLCQRIPFFNHYRRGKVTHMVSRAIAYKTMGMLLIMWVYRIEIGNRNWGVVSDSLRMLNDTSGIPQTSYVLMVKVEEILNVNREQTHLLVFVWCEVSNYRT
jgi:hypothetical protein